MFIKYVIKYSVCGKRMAYDCETTDEATYHAADIGGFDGVSDLEIKQVLMEELVINPSPYEIDNENSTP